MGSSEVPATPRVDPSDFILRSACRRTVLTRPSATLSRLRARVSNLLTSGEGAAQRRMRERPARIKQRWGVTNEPDKNEDIEDGRILAIGDIHGCSTALRALIDAIDPELPMHAESRSKSSARGAAWTSFASARIARARPSWSATRRKGTGCSWTWRSCSPSIPIAAGAAGFRRSMSGQARSSRLISQGDLSYFRKGVEMMTRFGESGGISYGLASRSSGRCAACRGTGPPGRRWCDPGHGAHKLSLHELPGDNELSHLSRNRNLAGGTSPVPMLLSGMIRPEVLLREVGR